MPRKSKNPNSVVAKLRESLALSQGELARLTGTSNITVGKWERDGINVRRGNASEMFQLVKGLIKQNLQGGALKLGNPRPYLRLAAMGNLAPIFSGCEGIEGDLLQGMQNGNVGSALVAMLIDSIREAEGKPRLVVEIEASGSKPELTMSGMSDEEMLEKLSG